MKKLHIETPSGMRLETKIKALYRYYATMPPQDRDYMPEALMQSIRSILERSIVVTEVV